MDVRPCGGVLRVWARDGEVEPVLDRTQRSAIANRSALFLSGFSAQEKPVVCWLYCEVNSLEEAMSSLLCDLMSAAAAYDWPGGNSPWSTFLERQHYIPEVSIYFYLTPECFRPCSPKNNSMSVFTHVKTINFIKQQCISTIMLLVFPYVSAFGSFLKLAYKTRKDIIARPTTHKWRRKENKRKKEKEQGKGP